MCRPSFRIEWPWDIEDNYSAAEKLSGANCSARCRSYCVALRLHLRDFSVSSSDSFSLSVSSPVFFCSRPGFLCLSFVTIALIFLLRIGLWYPSFFLRCVTSKAITNFCSEVREFNPECLSTSTPQQWRTPSSAFLWWFGWLLMPLLWAASQFRDFSPALNRIFGNTPLASLSHALSSIGSRLWFKWGSDPFDGKSHEVNSWEFRV